MSKPLSAAVFAAGWIAVAGIAVAVIAATEARAGPQSIGLFAMRGPIPLLCGDGKCTADLSGFCLEPRRDIPRATTPYKLAAGSVTLVLTRADGSSVRLPAAGRVRFASEREYNAVRAWVRQKLLADFAAVSAAVEIGPRVTLIPEPDGDGSTEHSPAEIELATGRLRSLAETIFEPSGVETDTVRLTAMLIHALPSRGGTDATRRRTLWQRVVVDRGLDSHFSAGAARARKMFRRCVRLAEYGYITPLRVCLALEHDALIARLMERYKAALGTS